MYRPKIELNRIEELRQHMDIYSAENIATKEVIMNDLENAVTLTEVKDILIYLINYSNISVVNV